MPVVSKRQNRFFRAHQGDAGRIGKVAREFIAATPKGGVKKLPDSVKAGKPRGERWYGKG